MINVIHTGLPIPRKLPVPRVSKNFWPGTIGWSLPSLVMKKTSPRTKVSPARVTMNGGRPSLAMTVPWTSPARMHTAIGTMIAIAEPYLDMSADSDHRQGRTPIRRTGRCRH